MELKIIPAKKNANFPMYIDKYMNIVIYLKQFRNGINLP